MKKLFSLLVLISLILFTGCSKDEVNPFGNIYGVVVNSNTSEPIQGARITLTPTGKSTITGNDGSYEFADLEAGTYKVTVQADGFASTLKNVTVVAGERAIGDVSISPKGQNSKLGVDKDIVNFTKDINTNTLYVKNLGNAGDINWEITGIPEWLEVSPVKGSTGIGKSSAVTLTLKSSFQGKADGNITINAAGESVSVIVLANNSTEGDGDGDGEDEGESDSENNGDFSGTTIKSPSSEIEIGITECKRSGSDVIFKFFVINKHSKDIEDFRIYGTFGGTAKGQIADNSGNNYFTENTSFKFAGKKTSPSGLVQVQLLKDIKTAGELIIKEVPEGTNELSVIKIETNIYDSDFDYMRGVFDFRNVPIY